MNADNMNIPMYAKIKVVMLVTRSTESDLPPSFTATTDLGCILFIHPRYMSFIMIITRMTFREPDVEAAHPPMNRSARNII